MNAKKSLKYCIAALVCLCMATMFSTAAFAADNWIDFAATDFAGGTGTEADPYQIATAEQLALLSVKVSDDAEVWSAGKYFKLTDDIGLSGKEWTPIGRAKNPGDNSYSFYFDAFAGTFDGDGHVVSGMSIIVSEDASLYLGLFGFVSGDVRSLGVTDFVISADCASSIRAGAIAGRFDKGTLENSFASGDISARALNDGAGAGGLVGYGEVALANSYAICNLSTDLLGPNASNASIPASATAGGLIGTLGGSKTVETSYAWGQVSASVFQVGSYTKEYAGGLAAEVLFEANVVSCDWLADVNPGLDAGIGRDVNAQGSGTPIDQSLHAASHDIDAFGVANIGYFIERGWDFGSGTPDYTDAVWCYIYSDNQARPHLRAFVDESDLMGGGGSGALVSTDKALDSLNNNATLKGLVSIATPSSADVNAALAEIATASGIASPKAIETVSGDLFKAKPEPDVENEDGVRSLVPSFTFMVPVGASGNVMPFAYTIIADAISTDLKDDWANISSADKTAYLEEDADEISTVFAYEYVTAGGTGDGEPVTLIGKGGKWTWAEMVGEGVVVFDGTTGDITVNYIAVPATGEPYIAGKFLVIPDKQPNPGYITDPVWLMRGKASTPPPGGNSGSGVGCDAGFAFFGLLPLLPLIARRRR